MQITFNNYTSEKVAKGKTSYEKMVISYSYQGQARTQTIMSFANPAVFAAVKQFNEGDLLDVEITKNDAGYNTWASVKLFGGEGTAAPGKPQEGAVKPAPARSTYETTEERATKQVYIIKQSSITAAINTLNPEQRNVENVLETARQYLDWVLDAPTQE